MSSRRVLVSIAFAVSGATAVAGVSAASPARTVGTRTTVSASEFKFKPGSLTTKARKLKITLKNTGRREHEFVVIRTKRKAGSLPMKGKEASEAGTIGEIDDVKAGRSKTRTFHLKRGRYVFLCNVEGHYKAGMYGVLTVK